MIGDVHDDINCLVCGEQIVELGFRIGGFIKRFEGSEIWMF
jgi:hypothetical protein